MNKLLLTYIHRSSFVERDISILQDELGYEVIEFQFTQSRNKLRIIWCAIKQLFFILFRIRKINVFYCWFSDFHGLIPAFLKRLFGKKMIVISGGYDAATLPQIGYGVFIRENLRSKICRYSFKCADRILCVDSCLIRSTNYFADPKGLEVGVEYFVPETKGRVFSLATGYDYKFWHKPKEIKKKNQLISVAHTGDMRRFELKGFDLLLELAKEFPETNFVLVGLAGEALEKAQSYNLKNVQLLGKTPLDGLRTLFAESKYVGLLSLSEGLPNSLCEGMLCECIPFGSNSSGIPNAIGDTGIILYQKNIDKAKIAFKELLKLDGSKGIEARNRAIQLFSRQNRVTGLKNHIEKL